jgi:hypothetical protein
VDELKYLLGLHGHPFLMLDPLATSVRGNVSAIHPPSGKGYSAKFAQTAFSEVAFPSAPVGAAALPPRLYAS